MYTTFIINIRGRYRREMFEGRPHLVVPCTMLKEGVFKGNKGAVFYSEAENAKSVPDWNHMPIVIAHPPKKSGQLQNQSDDVPSARTKEWLDARKVGILLNTSHVSKKLKTECWFDEERVKSVDERVYKAIINNQKMETSTGLGAEADETPGTFAGQKYKIAAKNYKPDHLAVLPDSVGAFSVAAGGGLFANMAQYPESVQFVLNNSVSNLLNSLGIEQIENEMSFSQISSQLAELLSSKYGEPGKYWRGWLVDVFSDRVIFYNKDDMHQIGYKVGKNDEVSLVGDAVKVERVVEYKPAGKPSTTPVRNEAGGLSDDSQTPAEESSTMPFEKKTIIDAMIQNGLAAETDRPTLDKLSDAELLSKAVVKPTPAPTQIQNTAPPPAPGLNEEQIVALLSRPAVRDAILGKDHITLQNQGMKALNASKERFIAEIKANPNNKFSDVQLQNMDFDFLAATAEIARGTVTQVQNDSEFLDGWRPDYSGAAAPIPGHTGITNQAGGKNDPPEAAKGGLQAPRLTELIINQGSEKTHKEPATKA